MRLRPSFTVSNLVLAAATVITPVAGLLVACGGSGSDGGGGGGGGTITYDGGNPFATDTGTGSMQTAPDATIDLDGGYADVSEPPVDAARTDYPIKHVIIIVKENHTFDSFFGSYTKPDGSDAGVEGTPTNQCCSPAQGCFDCPEAPDEPQNMCHEHDCAITDWDNGQMDGWDLTQADAGVNNNQVYAQYHREDIPNYYAYADNFTLGDHFFSSMLGPSFPGHMFTVAAQAAWATGNPPLDLTVFPPKVHPYWGCDETPGDTCPVQDQNDGGTSYVAPCFNIPSLPDILPGNVDWRFYGSPFTYSGYGLGEVWSMFNAVKPVRYGAGWSHVVGYDQFDMDIANGTLPEVTWLVNQDTADEHPGYDLSLCTGENWTVTRINEVMQSQYWQNTVILFTHDDFGGWYDHVPPPIQYGVNPTTDPYGVGFRLPLLIISPYAKPGYIFKEQSEQASLIRFTEKIFHATKTLTDLDPAARDKQANDLMDAFDFTQTPNQPLVLDTRSCN